MLLSFLLVAAFIFISLKYLHKKYSRQLSLAAQFSGPKAYPIIGNGHLFCTKSPVGKFLS